MATMITSAFQNQKENRSHDYLHGILNKYTADHLGAQLAAQSIYPIIQNWGGNFITKSSFSGSLAKGTAISLTSDADIFISFAAEQQVLKLKLELSSFSVTHDGVMGDVDEKHFIEILRRYLPNRYAVDSGIIIDSNGKCSDQIDVVIYDRQYTPTLLDQQSHRFIPVEAVYAVFEVKPTINKHYIEYAAKKAESVRKLTRTSVPIPHAGGEYPAKPLFSIIAGIVAGNMDWKNGFESKSFSTCYSSFAGLKTLDCGVAISYGSFDLFDKNQKLKICSTSNSLIYFIFRFLQKLQSLGTVPAIDWNKYAAVFER